MCRLRRVSCFVNVVVVDFQRRYIIMNETHTHHNRYRYCILRVVINSWWRRAEFPPYPLFWLVDPFLRFCKQTTDWIAEKPLNSRHSGPLIVWLDPKRGIFIHYALFRRVLCPVSSVNAPNPTGPLAFLFKMVSASKALPNGQSALLKYKSAVI